MDMTDVNQKLFDAFRADHAVLGRGLHELRTLILSGDAAAVRHRADALDREAGPHIAFEEDDFYPALKRFLSEEEVADMYAEHAEGLAVLNDLLSLKDTSLDDPKARQALARRIEAMESHVLECGELFGAMGGLSSDEKATLYRDLEHWREKAPRWTERPPLGESEHDVRRD